MTSSRRIRTDGRRETESNQRAASQPERARACGRAGERPAAAVQSQAGEYDAAAGKHRRDPADQEAHSTDSHAPERARDRRTRVSGDRILMARTKKSEEAPPEEPTAQAQRDEAAAA